VERIFRVFPSQWTTRSPILPRPSLLTSEERYNEQYANESSGAYQSPCANFIAGKAAINVSEMAHRGGRHHRCDENRNGSPESKSDDRVHAEYYSGYNGPITRRFWRNHYRLKLTKTLRVSLRPGVRATRLLRWDALDKTGAIQLAGASASLRETGLLPFLGSAASTVDITPNDLARLAQIAFDDFADLCRRKEYCRRYADRLRLICLCQGAAVTTSIMIVASGTSTYGVFLKRFAVIRFHTGDAANAISDHRNLGVTLTMMPSRGVR
jgi:hypothetical protein